MEWYFIGAFMLACAFIFIKWEIDYQKWKGPAIKSRQKHDMETTAISSTDVTSNLPGSVDIVSPDSSTQSTIASATNGFDSQDDLSNSDMGGNDSYGSDSGGYDNGGGYDSGGGYS